MPGLCGIISKDLNHQTEIEINLMMDCMLHESFYTSGSYRNKELGISIGWVCHKDSFSDTMPIFNEKKDKILLFYGENFIDPEIYTHLKAKRHKFERFNASYLIHLYEEESDNFFEKLNGWFTGILIDISRKKIILFNDRFGMQRLYYYEKDDAFLFSSEAKSILNIRPYLRKINMQSLAELISYNCVFENRSLFSKIFTLPGGSIWTFDNGRLEMKKSYFKPAVWENQTFLEKEFFFKRLQETFLKIIPRYFESRQNIGMSLTGGIDSRIIMAYANIGVGKLPCYTFNSMFRDTLDVKIARKVAKNCQQEHHSIPLDKQFLIEFPNIAEKTIYITDGNLDVSGAAELYVNRYARDIAPVRMTGNFGSEILRNSKCIKFSSLHENLFDPAFHELLHNTTKTFNNKKLESPPLSFTLFNELPWHEFNRQAIEQSQLTLRSPYMDNDLVSLLYRAPTEARNSKDLSLQLIGDRNPDLLRIMTDRGIIGNSHFPDLLLPYFYYQFLFKSEYYFNYGMPQWLAKLNNALKYFNFERLFLGRHKFYHFRVWFRDDLSDYVSEMLLDAQTVKRPYLNRASVEKIVIEHIKGTRNYTNEITKLITLELIQRLFIEQN